MDLRGGVGWCRAGIGGEGFGVCGVDKFVDFLAAYGGGHVC